MAAEVCGTFRTWSLDREKKTGDRIYRIVHLVRSEVTDGPFAILNAPGLPQPGDVWSFQDDTDPWAFCTREARVTPQQAKDNEQVSWWHVEQVFSTKPEWLCQDEDIEDPLLLPPRVSGSFLRTTEQATKDMHGDAINNSAHELLTGPELEFDGNRPTVRIEVNVPILGLDLWGPMVDHVNDQDLWGLPSRCVKLDNVSWERKYYGLCYPYYTLLFEFSINVKRDDNGNLISGFDRDVQDWGTKVLNGKWDTATGSWLVQAVDGYDGTPNPDPDRPDHFIRFKDRNGEMCKVLLNGHGLPAEVNVIFHLADVGDDLAAYIHLGSGTGSGIRGAKLLGGESRITDVGEIVVRYYPEANFNLLNLPLTF